MPTAVLQATKATYVDEANSATNYGSANPLYVGFNGSSQRKITLLEWDLSDIPADAVVLDVQLRLWLDDVTTPGNERISGRIITSAWSEDTVDHDALPTFRSTDIWGGWGNVGPTLDADQLISIDYSYNQEIEGHVENVDQLIRDVQNWVDGDLTNNGIMLYPSGDGVAEHEYAGRTASRTFFRPTLIVAYATADTLPASASDEERTFSGEAIEALSRTVMEQPEFSLTIGLDSGDLDVYPDLLEGSLSITRRLPFVGEKPEFDDQVFALANKDGKYSPSRRDSAFWHGAAEGKTITFRATVEGQTVKLYEGIIELVDVYGGLGEVQLLTRSKLSKQLEQPIFNAPTLRESQESILYFSDSANPVVHMYEAAHNRGPLDDADLNLNSFVSSETTIDTHGIKVYRIWHGRSLETELGELGVLSLTGIYQDAAGRLATHTWEPTSPSDPSVIEHWTTYRFRRERKWLANNVRIGMVQPRPWRLWAEMVTGVPAEPISMVHREMPDGESIAELGVYEKTIRHQYAVPQDAATLIARLHVQARAWPVEVAEITGPLHLFQYDLGDTIRLRDEDNGVNFVGIVTLVDLDPVNGDVRLEAVKANWPAPYHDYVRSGDWVGGTITPSVSTTLAAPTPATITGPTALDDGSQQIRVTWTAPLATFLRADGWAVAWKHSASSPAGDPDESDHDGIAHLSRIQTLHQINGLPQGRYVTIAVAAWQWDATGKDRIYSTFAGSAADPDWTDVVLSDADIISAGTPSNDPSATDGGSIATIEQDGSVTLTPEFTYSQGDVKADRIEVLVKVGTSAVGAVSDADDYQIKAFATPGQTSIKVQGLAQGLYYTVALVAMKETIAGPSYGSIVGSAASPDWTDLVASDAEITTALTPSNDPSPSSIDTFDDGVGQAGITLGWTYTQGDVKADFLVLIGNNADSSPVDVPTGVDDADWCVYLSPDATSFQMIQGKVTKYWTFKIAAMRKTQGGEAYGSFVGSAATPDWTDVQVAGAIQLDGSVQDSGGRSLTNFFDKTDDDSDDVTESTDRSFIHPDYTDASRRPDTLRKAAGDLAADDAFDKTADDAGDVSPTAARTFVHPDYVDGSLRPDTVRKTAGDVAADNILDETNNDLDDLPDGTTYKRTAADYLDGSNRPLVDSSKSTTVENFLGVVRVFSDISQDPPTSFTITHTVECTTAGNEPISYVVAAVFRMRSGYDTLRMTGYAKRTFSGSPSGVEGNMRLAIFKADGSGHVSTEEELILTASLVKYELELDVSGLTVDELYVMRCGMSATFTGGTGSVITHLLSPIVELLP